MRSASPVWPAASSTLPTRTTSETSALGIAPYGTSVTFIPVGSVKTVVAGSSKGGVGPGAGGDLRGGERQAGGEERESEHGARHHLPPAGCRATTVRLVGRSHSSAVFWMSSGVTASRLGSMRFTAAGSASKSA